MPSTINRINRCKPLLGTYVTVHLSADLDTATLMDISNRVFAEIEAIETKMSFHNPESELSFINREASTQPCDLSADMYAVLRTAVELSRLTAGRYDISIAPALVNSGMLPAIGPPVEDDANWQDIQLTTNRIRFKKPLLLDLGGIAKGYAVDKAFLAVSDEVDNLVINAGGDLRVKHWQNESVDIKTPNQRQPFITVAMADCAVATTASYYLSDGEYSIIDPDTRKPVEDHPSISVFAPSCMVADALTKAVLLAENTTELLQSQHASAAVVDQSGTIETLQ